MEVYIFRHGESVDDVEDCYGGIADFQLTDRGVQTAKDLVNKLSKSGMEVIYSSPYRRARQTAEIISSALHCELHVLDDLRERNSYGVISGVNKKKAEEIFGLVLHAVKGKPGDYYSSELLVGAESVKDFDNRIEAVFRDIIQRSGFRSIIGIVTHGNVIRSIYKTILSVRGKVDLDLSAVSLVTHEGAGTKLVSNEGVRVESKT